MSHSFEVEEGDFLKPRGGHPSLHLILLSCSAQGNNREDVGSLLMNFGYKGEMVVSKKYFY